MMGVIKNRIPKLGLFAGVTTIAGGKSNMAGYRDGPSEDAKFSSDFDVLYVRPTCSLLVVDRGNAALRQISLDQDDCDYQYSSISPTGSISCYLLDIDDHVLFYLWLFENNLCYASHFFVHIYTCSYILLYTCNSLGMSA